MVGSDGDKLGKVCVLVWLAKLVWNLGDAACFNFSVSDSAQQHLNRKHPTGGVNIAFSC